MCQPSPPAAPDYQSAAQAQGQANIDAAKTQGQINNPNVIGPTGTQSVTWGPGTFDQAHYTDALKKYRAAVNNSINIFGSFDPVAAKQQWGLVAPTKEQFTTGANTPTIKQTLSPEQQAIYNQSTANQQKLGALAGQGADALQGVVGKPVDFSGAPQTGSYDSTRKAVIDAMMGRANEDYTKATDNSNSNLIAAGIRPGSTAYGNAQQMIERSRNDARQQAEIAGGNAASQAYGVDEARRRQAITEQLAQRQTPINEISALMSGSQVNNPFSMPGYAQNSQVQPTPSFAATNAQGQYGTDVYNAQAAGQGNLQSGLFGLGGSALMGLAMSDRRTKRSAHRIGTHALGIGIYSFRYRKRQWGKGHFIGVMADEVLRVRPEAVIRMPDGYLAVDYGQLS